MKIINKEPPPPKRGKALLYPFDQMNAGSAYEVGQWTREKQISVSTAARQWAKRQGLKKAKFSTRNENGTLFLYRTA